MTRRAQHFTVFLVALLTLAFCIPAIGQVTKGSISGTVTDSQGAVVSGAQVKATHVDTGTVSTTTSDSSGLFRFNLLPVGSYNVEISQQGFKTTTQKNVKVVAGEDVGTGSVRLTVGEKSETLEVTAAAPLIESTQAQVTNTFAGTELQSFAGIQENEGLDRLALFVPGVAASRSDNFSNANGGGFSSGGQRGRNNDQELDGQNNNDNSVGGPSLFVSDTNFVDQYILITNNFGPEYGRNGGSVVNIITKSGTNNWHGSLYGTENNSYLNALSNTGRHLNKPGTNAPGNVSCPVTNVQCNPLTGPLRSNDVFGGGTISGPLVKNKWFLFGGYDNELFAGNTFFTTSNLTPTPAGLATLAGCFPAGSVQAQQVATLTKFGPYGISAGNPGPNGTPVAATVAGCPGVLESGINRVLPTPSHAFNFVNKVDGQLSSKDNFSARYIFNRNNSFNSSDNPVTGYAANVTALSQAVLLSWTRNITSRMVNEFRVGFDRLNVDFGGNNIGNTLEPTQGGILNALTNVSILGGFSSFGPATNFPQGRLVNTWQAQDNWNYVLGKHQFKAGVNWTYQRSPNTFLPNINGAFRYNGLSNYINGNLNRVQIAQGNPVLDFREYDTFLYAGDDWKIRSNLTLNLGLTWTYYGNPAQLFTDVTSKREANPATAFWLQSLPLSVRTNPTIPTVNNSFGPSIGFAYQPQWGGFLTGHGKTTIRGGYRLLYDPPFYNIFLNTSTSSPFGFLQTLTATSTPNLAGVSLPGNPTGPNVRTALASFIAKNTLDPRTQNETTLSPNFGPDQVQSWSLGFERELTKNSAFEARYAGNHSTNLYQTVDGNPFAGLNIAGQHGLLQDFPNLIPNASSITPCAATAQVGPGAGSDVGRVNCGLGVVRERNNGGFSDYHSLQTEFRANNLFKQLTLRAGYTFSKTLDNVSEIFATGTAGNTAFASQNPFQTGGAERSFSGLNFPNVFTVALTESIPFFKEQHGAVGHLLGGWSISSSYVIASGQPYTATQGNIFGNLSAIGAAGNYFDTAFNNAFVNDSARPFFGNKNAAAGTVGIYCGDARSLFGVSAAQCAAVGGNNTLISFNAFNAPQACDSRGFIRGGACTVPVITPITTNDVRFIVNMHTAEAVFGTPIGNVPRNGLVDARSNRLDASISKFIKIGERSNFEMRMSATNALNHFNFASIDPNIEDAGLTPSDIRLFGAGFANPAQTGANGRVVTLSGKFTF